MKKLSIVLALTAILVLPALSNAAKYASIIVKRGNVRTCPGMDCKIKFYMWKYTPVEMLQVSEDKNWVEVKDFEGYKGWVHKTLLGDVPSMSAKEDVNVRSGPGASNSPSWIVKKGYTFKFLEQKDGWYKVSDDEGTTGWIYGSLLWGFTKYVK